MQNALTLSSTGVDDTITRHHLILEPIRVSKIKVKSLGVEQCCIFFGDSGSPGLTFYNDQNFAARSTSVKLVCDPRCGLSIE